MAGNRRGFIRVLIPGAAGLALGEGFRPGTGFAAERKADPVSRVSFVAGNDRRDLVFQALKPFEKEIREGIRGRQVVIKPNCVWDGNPLCATHPDAIRGVLDFLQPMYKGKVIIAESTASPKGTMACFQEYQYFPLQQEFNARLMDLNTDSWSVLWIQNNKLLPNDIKIINTFLDPKNYIISLARMKTHDCVVGTLAFKNILMAAPLNVIKGHPLFVKNQHEKAKMHEGAGERGVKGFNYNMFTLAQRIRPDFSVIDGFEGMEGNGPTRGTPVDHRIVVAGPDVVSVDRIGLEAMGIDYTDVGYLQWCSAAGIGQGDREKIQVLGANPSDHVKKYRLADNIEWQLTWKQEG
jgi:uncharacterized protein (DUF362 family)